MIKYNYCLVFLSWMNATMFQIKILFLLPIQVSKILHVLQSQIVLESEYHVECNIPCNKKKKMTPEIFFTGHHPR